MNGGASAALMAFISHLATGVSANSVVPRLALPLLLLLGGVLSAGLASGGTYLAQSYFGAQRSTVGRAWNTLAICFVVGSYFTFAFACWEGFKVLRDVAISSQVAPEFVAPQ